MERGATGRASHVVACLQRPWAPHFDKQTADRKGPGQRPDMHRITTSSGPRDACERTDACSPTVNVQSHLFSATKSVEPSRCLMQRPTAGQRVRVRGGGGRGTGPACAARSDTMPGHRRWMQMHACIVSSPGCRQLRNEVTLVHTRGTGRGKCTREACTRRQSVAKAHIWWKEF